MTLPLFRPLRALALLGLLSIGMPAAHATEPLIDSYSMDGRTGKIAPSGCCWVPLPHSELLLELKRAQRCSAIGGPVGMFALRDGKLWLTGLRTCSREMDLREVYPDLPSPALADWLTGTFRTFVDFQCYQPSGRSVYALTQTLEVKDGVVTSVVDTPGDLSTCPVRDKPQ